MNVHVRPALSASPIVRTVVEEIERIVEAHGGKIAVRRLHDLGLRVSGSAWQAAIHELESRHGAWLKVKEGILIIATDSQRKNWGPRQLHSSDVR